MVTEVRCINECARCVDCAKDKAEEIACMYRELESELDNLQADVDRHCCSKAEASLDCITPGDITVVRSLANPPAL